jgi:hypothetical protein
MEKVNPAQIHAITSTLSMEEQKLLQSIVQQAKENQEEHENLNLNGD